MKLLEVGMLFCSQKKQDWKTIRWKTIRFCDTVENMTNPMNNISKFFTPLDDKRKKEMTKTFFNSLPNDPKRT